MPIERNEFLELIRDRFPTASSLAEGSGLTLEEAEGIFAGKNPDVIELGFLSSVLKKHNDARWSTEELIEMCDRVYGPFEEE